MSRMYREKSSGQFSDTPYVVALANCVLWIIYTLKQPGRIQPLVTNGFGAVCQITYVVFFLALHPANKRKILMLKMLVLVIGGAALLAVAQSMEEAASINVIGITADIFNAGMYAAPLGAIGTVVQTRSVDSMPLGLTLGCLFASIMWGTYAKWVGDGFMGLPNDAGLMLGIAQVIIYMKYRTPTKDLTAEKLVSSGVKVADGVAAEP